ncbi:inorganic phosphate transporter [Novosphingobium terrae]|uniref:inorganic phosphate transporter n=1 Tax=Novosphingobium terrae TaxID=2726189 RepID=UPI00197D18D0|nr:inorganic phosphate transporter [Novosphingobium terrae]
MNATLATPTAPVARADLDKGLGTAGKLGFLAAMLVGIGYVASSVYSDASAAGVHATAFLPYALLFIALLIALGFEFVNGFHDTANAVATVIYTNSMPANVAVVWSGFFNFMGVLVSTGTVAFGIISLLPVELILQVGAGQGFAMVFALLIAAILWNLATWFFGIPNSSSHTLIGSVIGVGVANALLHGRSGTSGVDWTQAANIGRALLFSPILGFIMAGALFFVARALVRVPALYREPQNGNPPPLWIRILLIGTCTGVSFFHGSNDGQKGMGLIMLILIGTVPTAYALNRAVPSAYEAQFHTGSAAAAAALAAHSGNAKPAANAEKAVETYIATKEKTADTVASLGALVSDIDSQVKGYGSLARVPATATRNMRNDMYLASEGLKLAAADKSIGFSDAEAKALTAYKGSLDKGTRFIPTWVKVAVALALGLGTMVGWKRIVVTVGEKIGKTHLTYAQGAAAEITAMATIGMADAFGLPVSTTHVLSSGVAGTMAANGSGLQASTLRNMALAWVLTLPCSILISGVLYVILSAIF